MFNGSTLIEYNYFFNGVLSLFFSSTIFGHLSTYFTGRLGTKSRLSFSLETDVVLDTIMEIELGKEERFVCGDLMMGFLNSHEFLSVVSV